MKSKELYPAIFSRHAEAYQRRLDDVMARGEARGRSRVLELIGARPGMLVLDLACGPATLTAPIAAAVEPHGRVVGIDLALGMVDRARARHIAGADFAVVDMERLAFRDATFDAVTCGHGLQFVPDLGAALTETRRVLKPGAVFAASLPLSLPQRDVPALLDEAVRRWLTALPEVVDQNATRAAVSDPAALSRLAQDTGFRDVEVETVEEKVRWQSAEELVTVTSAWWDCAARLELSSADQRKAFHREAVDAVRRRYPGRFETSTATLVLAARA